MKVFSDILSALDNGQITVLTLLDLSAAFDTIDHDILLTISSMYLAFRIYPYSGSNPTLSTGHKLYLQMEYTPAQLILLLCSTGTWSWTSSLHSVHSDTLKGHRSSPNVVPIVRS